MTRDTLTGSRIRERRTMAGMRQAELARAVGISASYLNLIEHNRRRIGGKLLVDISTHLGVEPSVLSEGAEAALVAALREAAASVPDVAAERDQTEDFAGRFPGWAALLSALHQKVVQLEHTTATLTDRLTHDPHLATSMHEVLTMVTAIRATAGILADTKEIEPEWRNRFHRNLNEDSQRLAESSQLLVRYLDAAGDAGASLSSPQEEVESFLAAHGDQLETWVAGDMDLSARVAEAPELSGIAARDLAERRLVQARSDARAMPLRELSDAIEQLGLAPAAIAGRFAVSLAAVFRRLAALPEEVTGCPVGLVSCDASGMLLQRKPIEGFAVPRFSAACPVWPLFQALGQPGRPIHQNVVVTGRDQTGFSCFAVTEPLGQMDFDSAPMVTAYMLILPQVNVQDRALEIGATCRICPSADCAARREPSILTEGI